MNQADKDELVEVGTASTAVEAEMIKNFLVGQGVKCAIEGGNQAGFVTAIPIRLMVRAWDADHAKKLLKKEGF